MHEKLLHYCAITELGSMLRSGETTPTGLTEHFIERIEKLNGPLTAFNLVTAERAMVEAEAMEALMRSGRAYTDSASLRLTRGFFFPSSFLPVQQQMTLITAPVSCRP